MDQICLISGALVLLYSEGALAPSPMLLSNMLETEHAASVPLESFHCLTQYNMQTSLWFANYIQHHC